MYRKYILWILLVCLSMTLINCGDDSTGPDDNEGDYHISGIIERTRQSSQASAFIILIEEVSPGNYTLLSANDAEVRVNDVIIPFDDSQGIPAFISGNLTIPALSSVEVKITSTIYGNITRTLTMPADFPITSPLPSVEYSPGQTMTVEWGSAEGAEHYYVAVYNPGSGMYHFEKQVSSGTSASGWIYSDPALSGQIAAKVVVRAFSGEYFNPNQLDQRLGFECSVTSQLNFVINQ